MGAACLRRIVAAHETDADGPDSSDKSFGRRSWADSSFRRQLRLGGAGVSSGSGRLRQFIGTHFVRSEYFQSFVALVILCNAVVVGLETDKPELAALWDVFELVFLAVFSLEISLRLFYLRPSVYFCGRDSNWNIFDFIIVTFGLLDSICESFSELRSRHEFGEFGTMLRMLRLFRILRLFRLLRMLKQLHVLASSFVEAMTSVCWVVLLVILCLYVCAVLLTRLGRHSLLHHVPRNPSEQAAVKLFEENFGNVITSMFTLFELMACPDLTRFSAIVQMSNTMKLFFIFFIIFANFAMLAMLTGVIAEGMVMRGTMRQEELRFEEERKRQRFRERLRTQFSVFDASGDGLLDHSEFLAAMPAILTLLAEEDPSNMQYTAEDMMMIFNLMGNHTGSAVNVEEFLHGMEQFECQLHQLPLQFMKMQATVTQRYNVLEHELKRVTGLLQTLLDCDEDFQTAPLALADSASPLALYSAVVDGHRGV